MRVVGDRAARRVTGEDGLTVVEVIVAGMILVVGSLGVLGMVDAATRNTFRVEQSQVVANVLQREMEEIKGLPYEEVALTTLPTHASNEADPNWRVEGTAFYTNRNGTGGLKPLVYGGSVAPGPESFEVDDVKGSIYRYVVWDKDCSPIWLCEGGEFRKRIIVAVRLDTTASGGVRRYQEVQGQMVDPEAEPSENPGPAPGGGTATPWLLWLTDATCDRSEPKMPLERAEEGDHVGHNTRGTCATGPKSGNAPGAPDLLWPEAPPLSDETPVYDYAIDVEPLGSPDHDKGLQLLVGKDCGAMPATMIATSPDSDPATFQKLHKWVTPPIPDAVTDLTLTGDATLSLWTQSIEGGVYAAQICAYLFVREAGADVALLRPLDSLPYFTYSGSPWPSSGWAQITVSLDFKSPTGGQVALAQGSRLGLAISVDDGSGSGIQTLYDEPSFDSRIQLNATGTLPTWP
jgi:hypothetical protein